MKILLPNFFYDLQAPQIFICSKTDIGGIIPLMAKSSTYYFYMKTKILADFQICISLPLDTSADCGNYRYQKIPTKPRRTFA